MPPENPDDLSTLERMRRRLYAPKAPESFPAPVLVPAARADAVEPEGWAPTPAPVIKAKRKVSYAALFLGIAGIFFLIALSAAAYFLVLGGRAVSTDRIDITVDGPTTIGSGDTVTLLVSIDNRNPVAARETMLSIEFPDTARAPENPEMPFSRFEDTVGDIAAGETGTRSIPVVLYGSENERLTIPVRFEYRVEGSNAVFVKETEYDVTITSSPISIRAEAVSEASAGQPVTFAVTVRSNAQTPLENVAVLASYPFGFIPKRGEGPVFPVGTLAPGEEKTIAVSGTLSGEDDEERVFRFTVGTSREPSANLLTISYATTPVAIGLKKPFLLTSLTVDRDGGAKPVVSAGTQVQSVVSWVNTLATPILDGRVEVKLAGSALDTTSISAFGGFYRSSDSTIVYSKESDAGLGNLVSGGTGNGTFSFRTKPSAALIGTKNPTVVATVSVAGRRVDRANAPESVPSTIVRTIKIATDLSLAATSRYTTGPFKNTGPWPPVADQETTYTVDLIFKNTVNTVADTVVTGQLPSYVTFVAASDSSVTYNATNRTVTWKAGEVAAGAGYGTAAKQASFQVRLLPSASQRGTSPVLVSSLRASGYDKFVEGPVEVIEDNVTTVATGDPAFLQGKGEVQ